MDVSKKQLQHHVAHPKQSGGIPFFAVQFEQAGAVSTDGRRLLLVERPANADITKFPPGMKRSDGLPIQIPAGQCARMAQVLSDAERAVVGLSDKPGFWALGYEDAFGLLLQTADIPDRDIPWRDVMLGSMGAFRGLYDLGLLIDLLGKLKGSSTREKPTVTIRFVADPPGGVKSDGRPTERTTFRLHFAVEGAQAMIMGIDEADDAALDDHLGHSNPVPVGALSPGMMFADVEGCSPPTRFVVVHPNDPNVAPAADEASEPRPVKAVDLEDGMIAFFAYAHPVYPMNIGGRHG